MTTEIAQDFSNTGYDIEAVRAQFPILAREIYGKPLTYLDNASSAQKPQSVIDAIQHSYRNEYANVHRGLHFLSNAATDAFENARETVQRFLNAPSEDEIIFTRNTTEAINLVAQSYGLDHIGEGDEIILSILEHHSNIVPWHFLRERHGAVIKWAPIDEDGNFLIEEFAKMITSRTKLVAITQMSNAIGTVVPVEDVIKIAHEHDIKVLIDGSQAAVHMPIDVQELDADFYVVTGHKLYGPSGIGALYGKRELLSKMRPYMGGGEMIKDVTCEGVTYNDIPHRFEAGTPPIVQAIAFAEALTYMMDLGLEHIQIHENMITAYAAERLKEIKSLQLYGHAENKGGIFSFNMKGAHAHDISMVIDREGVAVRAGTHCAQPLLNSYGVTSTCRASVALYTNETDIDRLITALLKAEDFFS